MTVKAMAVEPEKCDKQTKLGPPKIEYWVKFYHKSTHETFCKASFPQLRAQFRFWWLRLCTA